MDFGVRQPLLVLIIDNDGSEEADQREVTADEEKELVYAPEVPTIGSVGLSLNRL